MVVLLVDIILNMVLRNTHHNREDSMADSSTTDSSMAGDGKYETHDNDRRENLCFYVFLACSLVLFGFLDEHVQHPNDAFSALMWK